MESHVDVGAIQEASILLITSHMWRCMCNYGNVTYTNPNMDEIQVPLGGRTMKKVIDEIKKHKKAMIGVAVIVVIFAWVLITNEPAPVEAQ